MSEKLFLSTSFTHLPRCELVHSGCKLPLNEHACMHKIGFCVMSENLFLFTSFTNLLCCELVHSQSVSCL